MQQEDGLVVEESAEKDAHEKTRAAFFLSSLFLMCPIGASTGGRAIQKAESAIHQRKGKLRQPDRLS